MQSHNMMIELMELRLWLMILMILWLMSVSLRRGRRAYLFTCSRSDCLVIQLSKAAESPGLGLIPCGASRRLPIWALRRTLA